MVKKTEIVVINYFILSFYFIIAVTVELCYFNFYMVNLQYFGNDISILYVRKHNTLY